MTRIGRSAASRSRPYVLLVLCAGVVALGTSLPFLWDPFAPTAWWVLALLTLVSGSAVLKLPAIPAHFSISDVFTLTAAVAFGPKAATVIVAIDSLAISARLVRTGLPAERVLFNAAAPPVAMWVSAQLFFLASGFTPLYSEPLSFEIVTPWMLMFSGVYFVLNTMAIAVAIALHERVGIIGIWRAHFQTLWFTFLGGGLGAVIVVFALGLGAYGLALLAIPLLLAYILHFAYRNATGRVADQLQHLAEVNRLHLSTIEALAHAIDAKDAGTHGHIRRVQQWAIALAKRIGVEDDIDIRAIEAAALLHDIGKLAIPEHILNKPGKLTNAEFERMKTHARVGAEILSEIDFPYPVVPIVRHHHENWNGTGYPDGIAGKAIPIGARILAVVDCYDALTSDRPYRRALTSAAAFAIIEERSGTMYDPAVVAAFRAVCSNEIAKAPSITDTGAMRRPARPTAALEAAAGSADDDVRTAMELGIALAGGGVSAEGGWDSLTTALVAVPGVDTAVVYRIEEAEQRLVAMSTSGLAADAISRISIPIGERMSGWVAANGQPMVGSDAELDLFDVNAPALRSGVAVSCVSVEGVPVVVALYSCRVGVFSPFYPRLLAAAAALGGRDAIAEHRPRSLTRVV